MLPGGLYGSTDQVIRLKRGAAVLRSRIYSQLQLLADRQCEQLLVKIVVICQVRQLKG